MFAISSLLFVPPAIFIYVRWEQLTFWTLASVQFEGMDAVPYEEERGPQAAAGNNWLTISSDTSPVVLHVPAGEYETRQLGKHFTFSNDQFNFSVFAPGTNITRGGIRAELESVEERDLDVSPETQWRRLLYSVEPGQRRLEMSSADTARLRSLLTMRRMEAYTTDLDRAIFFIRPNWEGVLRIHERKHLFCWYTNDGSLTGEIMFHGESQEAKQMALEIAKRIEIRCEAAHHKSSTRFSE